MSGVANFQPVQQRIDVDTRPFVLEGHPKNLGNAVLADDDSRSGDLLTFTVLAKFSASGEYAAYDDVSDTDGRAVPAGIYLGPSISESDIQAGPVSLIAILTDNATFDDTRLIFEGGINLATEIGSGVEIRTVEDELRKRQLIPNSTRNRSGTEN